MYVRIMCADVHLMRGNERAMRADRPTWTGWDKKCLGVLDDSIGLGETPICHHKVRPLRTSVIPHFWKARFDNLTQPDRRIRVRTDVRDGIDMGNPQPATGAMELIAGCCRVV